MVLIVCFLCLNRSRGSLINLVYVCMIGQRCNVYIHGGRFFNTELIKCPWTQEEDDKIIDLVNKYGLTKWSHCKVSYQNFLLLILGCFRTCSRTCSIYPL
ncbi:hypothetical protein ACQJBY_062376 [Aegilops geniculata]